MKRSFTITVTIHTNPHLDGFGPRLDDDLTALTQERVENAANVYLHYMGKEILSSGEYDFTSTVTTNVESS